MPERSEGLAAVVAARLACVRGDMSDADFERLVADVVRTALRFEEIDARLRSRSGPVASVPVLETPERPPKPRPTTEG